MSTQLEERKTYTADQLKGKRYGSKASAFQVIIQGPRPKRHPTTGDIIGYEKELVAEFALLGKEIDVPGPGGEIIKTADIHGHYFDSLQQAEEKGWTVDERLRVEDGVDRICKQQPGQVWQLTDPVYLAPWPSYDTTHHNQIPIIAQQTGLVSEAILYERQNKNRETVLVKLEERLAEQESAVEAEQALTVA